MRATAIGIGAAGSAAVGLGSDEYGAVGEAEAIPPIVVAGGPVIALGWALREYEVIGSNPPAEGLTPEVLRQNIYDGAKKRRSNNKSTFVDNRNLLDGLKNTAYTDGKIAAIEKLNEEVTQSEVQDAALAAVDDYATTVQGNLLRSWNELASEVSSFLGLLGNSSDLSKQEVLNVYKLNADTFVEYRDPWETSPVTMPDGTEQDVVIVDYRRTNDTTTPGNVQINVSDGSVRDFGIEAVSGDGSTTNLLDTTEWGSLYSDMESTFTEVRDGLAVWVNNVYGEVQSGDIEVADLLTPRERAELLSDDEEYPQAVADLIALNIPVDPNREATISLNDRDITLVGLMTPTSPPENGFVSGETYDPTSAPWDLYFTYDPSKGSGGWTEYEPVISEGELRFTAEPYEQTLYRIPVSTGETVEVTSGEFTETDSGGVWIADVSEQVSRSVKEWTDYQSSIDGGEVTFTALPDESADFTITANDGDVETVSASDFTDNGDGTYTVSTGLGIAEIEAVEAEIDRTEVQSGADGGGVSIYSEDSEPGYKTIQIKESFTIDKIEDSSGNEVGASDFTQTEPQDDTNYITQEEWNELEQQNQELIDKYEQATKTEEPTSAGGGSGFFSGGGPSTGAIAAVVGVIGVGYALFGQGEN